MICCLSPDKCHKVHELSTTDALCSSRKRSFLFKLGKTRRISRQTFYCAVQPWLRMAAFALRCPIIIIVSSICLSFVSITKFFIQRVISKQRSSSHRHSDIPAGRCRTGQRKNPWKSGTRPQWRRQPYMYNAHLRTENSNQRRRNRDEISQEA